MGERVWVYLEREGAGVSDGSLQAASLALALAREAGASLEGVVVGGGIPELVPQGLSRVHQVTGPGLEQYTTQAFGRALEGLAGPGAPAALVFPPGSQGEDLASWMGAAMGGGALLGVREVRREGGRLVAIRREFEGKVAVEYEMAGVPAVFSVEDGAAPPAPVVPTQGMEASALAAEPSAADAGVRVLRAEVAQRAVDLRQARVVVGVGAGVGGKEGFEQARALARLLGGELGATRAAVDAGWVAHERQIGQTGVKIKPDLYVACGISGAAQHRVGMLDSGTIVSINIDPQAPMFRFSHFCVVGDARTVVPKLVELLGG
jgi:electron transfer flavoprotein alpha subunit